jgi:hypothetical protein
MFVGKLPLIGRLCTACKCGMALNFVVIIELYEALT